MASLTGPIDPSSPLAIIVTTTAQAFKPLYTTLITACIWSAMLVPLFVVLLFFSNKELRQKPVFYGNIFAICVGIVLGGLTIGIMMAVLSDPLVPPQKPLIFTFATFMSLSSILVESVLLIRVWAVFPFRTTPRLTFLAVFTTIGLIKTARIINMIIYLAILSNWVKSTYNALILLQQAWTQIPYYRIEWFLQVADNSITSGLFLFKLNRGRGIKTRLSGSNWGATLEAMFWIAVSNFVIPVILSIVQLIVIWLSTDIFNVVPIFLTNLYVEIIGVLLATVWSAGTTWQESKSNGIALHTFSSVNMSQTSFRPQKMTSEGSQGKMIAPMNRSWERRVEEGGRGGTLYLPTYDGGRIGQSPAAGGRVRSNWI